MTTTTGKGVPIPDSDGDDPNDVPSDLGAIGMWLDAHPGIEAVTTTERNALVAPDIWPGMIVFNKTTGHLEQNTTGTSGSANWLPLQIDPAGIADRSLPAVKLVAASVTDTEVAAANKDGAAGTPSLRTLGTGAAQAAPGNHDHDVAWSSLSGVSVVTTGITGSPSKSLRWQQVGKTVIANYSLNGTISSAATVALPVAAKDDNWAAAATDTTGNAAVVVYPSAGTLVIKGNNGAMNLFISVTYEAL